MEVGYSVQSFLILTGRTENNKGHVFNYQARTCCHGICRNELPRKQQRILDNAGHCSNAHMNHIYMFCAMALGVFAYALNQTECYGNFMHGETFLARNICDSSEAPSVMFLVSAEKLKALVHV